MLLHQLVNALIEHYITQLLYWGYSDIISNRYWKVMFKIPEWTFTNPCVMVLQLHFHSADKSSALVIPNFLETIYSTSQVLTIWLFVTVRHGKSTHFQQVNHLFLWAKINRGSTTASSGPLSNPFIDGLAMVSPLIFGGTYMNLLSNHQGHFLIICLLGLL